MRTQVWEYEAWALAVANIQLASLQIKVGNLTGLLYQFDSHEHLVLMNV